MLKTTRDGMKKETNGSNSFNERLGFGNNLWIGSFKSSVASAFGFRVPLLGTIIIKGAVFIRKWER